MTAPVTDLVTLSDVATHLNWSTAEQSQYAGPMARFISACTTVVEKISGPVVQRSYDEWYTGGKPRIQLDNYPVVGPMPLVTESFGANTIWTLTEQPLDGSSGFNAFGYTIDRPTGQLIRRFSGVASPFAMGARNVHVQYTAGMCANTASVPPNIAQAALELIRINWQPVQAGNVPQFGTAAGVDQLDVAESMHMGWFIPPRVLEVLKPNANRFAIA